MDSPSPGLDRANVESILQVRPLQQALLFHRAPGAGDPGLIQARIGLQGPVDPQAFEAAWNEVLRRHEALRMSVHTSPRGDTRIIVWRELALGVTHLDVRSLPADVQAERIDAFLAEDRAAGLDVTEPPAMRVALVRTADDAAEAVWTCHHLFLDGWSTAIVVDEMRRLHEAHRTSSGPALPPVRCSTRHHRAWLDAQDPTPARDFWRERLRDLDAAPPLRLRPGVSSGFATTSLPLTETAAAHGVTPNALAQGAWALVLGLLLDRDDVVFGTTVSGRAAPIDGLETMVGLLANVAPVRARIDPDQTAVEWLRQLRDAQLDAQPFEHCELADVQTWAGRAAGHVLFESLLVVENFPWQSGDDAGAALRVSSFASDVTSTYPLTMTVVPGAAGRIACTFDRSRFDAAAIDGLLRAVGTALDRLAAEPDAPLAEHRDRLHAEFGADLRCAANDAAATGDDGGALGGPPLSAYEIQLARIWEDVLGVAPIGRLQDFFQLGGRSIAAVRIFALVEERFGKRLPPTLILEHPTIEGLARAVEHANPEDIGRSVVTIQPGAGDGAPVFFVHSGAEEAFLFRGVAGHLGPDQPVHVFQAMSRRGAEPAPETIQAIAAHYIRDLRELQPHGPYRLVGYCFGGIVAFEMAHQLRGAGEPIAVLAAVDAPPPLLDAPSLVARARRVMDHHGVVAGAYLGARQATRWAIRRFKRRLPEGVIGAEEQLALELKAMRRIFHTAYQAYRPEPLDLPITIIRSSDNDWLAEGDLAGWEELVPSVESHVVSGGHTTMFLEPAVAELSALVASMLEAGPVD